MTAPSRPHWTRSDNTNRAQRGDRVRHPPLSRQFWQLWSGAAGSNMGDGVALVALPLLAVHLTSNPQLISLVSAAQTLPWLVFGLVAGALVDAVERHRLCIAVNLARSAGLLAFSVLVLLGRCDLVAVYVAAALVGTGQVVFDSASVALVRDAVPANELERANGRFMSAEIVAGRFVGQPIGGLLFALRRWIPFAFDTAMYGVAALIMSFRRERSTADTCISGSSLKESLQGIGGSMMWFVRHSVLRGLALRVAVMAISVSAAQSVLVLVAIDRMGLSSASFGFWLTAEAAGAAVGSVIASRVIARVGPDRSIQGALLLVTGAFLLLAFSRNPLVGGLGLIFLGVASPLWNVVTVSLRQRLVPAEIFGRVNSAYMVAVWGGLPIGSVIGGALARGVSLPSVYIFGAAVMVLLLLTGGNLYRNLRSSGSADSACA